MDEDDFDELGPAEEGDHEYEDEDDDEPDEEEEHEEVAAEDPGHAGDLLAESPKFAEDGTDEEDLWFEQGPPKDFDFEDEK